MFAGCTGLTSADLSGWKTPALTDITYMFSGDSVLASLDLSGWDTSHLSNMDSAFRSCTSLQSLDLSGWDLGGFNTTDTARWRDAFSGDNALTTVTARNWTAHQRMGLAILAKAPALATLDASGWDLSRNTDSTLSWFAGFPSLATLNARDWQFAATPGTGKGDNIGALFYNAKISSIDATGWKTANVLYMGNLFENNPNLTTITGLGGWDTGSATTMSEMFRDDTKLASLDLHAWNTAKAIDMSYMFMGCTNLTSLDLHGWDARKTTNMSYMFTNLTNLTSLDLHGWDARTTNNMTYMFVGDTKLQTLDLHGWNVSSLSSTAAMFAGCTGLTSADLSGWKTPALTDITYMFSGDSVLASLDLSGWDTSHLSNMDSAFRSCTSLQSLDLSGWDLGGFNTTDTARWRDAFSGDNALTTVTARNWTAHQRMGLAILAKAPALATLDASGWDLSRNTDSTLSWFAGFPSLATLNARDWQFAATPGTGKGDNIGALFYNAKISSIDATGWKTANVLYMGNLFENNPNLTTITGLGGWDTGSATTMSEMFRDDTKLASLDLHAWNTAKAIDMSYMFMGCTNLTSLDLHGWDARKTTNMSYMFTNLTNLTSLDLHGWDARTTNNMTYMFVGDTKLQTLDLHGWNVSSLSSTAAMFAGCTGLTSADLSGWKTPALTDITYMFSGDSVLASLDLSGWDTSHLSNMDSAFRSCTSLQSLDLSGWDLGGFNTTDTARWRDAFSGDNALTTVTARNWTAHQRMGLAILAKAPALATLDASGWDLSRNTDSTLSWFAGFPSLATLNARDWQFAATPGTGKGDNIGALFYNAKISSIDATGWKTANVLYMGNLFENNPNLTTITGLGGWDTGSATTMSEMFRDDTKLASLDLHAWNTAKAIDMSYMFMGCTNLTSLDLHGWDARKTTNMSYMMPEALRVLVLGSNTKLTNANAFALVQATSWKRLSGYGVNATVTDTFPTKAGLSTRVASNPEGVYVDSTLPGLQIEVDANGGTTSFQPALTNTTSGAANATVPTGEVLTSNNAASLFTGWKDDYGNPVTAGSVIHLSQTQYNPCRIMVLHAQWRSAKPSIGDVTTHVANDGTATFEVTATETTTLTSGADSTNPTHSWTCVNGTCTVNDPVVNLEATPGAQYTLTASAPLITDPNTHNTVSGGTDVKQGYLEYAKATFDGNGATAGVPAAISAFADSSTHQTYVKIPRNTIPTKGDSDLFAGWSTSNSATQSDSTYDPDKTLTGTTEAGKSTTLYAVWRTLAKPSVTAERKPADGNKVAVTATSKPLAAGDTIHYCITPSAVDGGSFPATCWDDTVSAGSWDGATEHESTHTIAESDMPSGGHYDLTATIKTKDTWRLPANSTVSNSVSTPNVFISGPELVALPLTGGRSWRIAMVLALDIVLILLMAATALRNRRRQARHSR
ncbi:BspA family leucine-rich repeat surface protein [Bifidobacterium sp. ESL0775]|uniref:BspA family leucine-rich repeat surface protein n=1 Tax=Bifidobacterium sp. ESL0775 TaxID=2983230 RepID=UPI0023F90D22|nr:BspA family leucine-rich repeat surface protein [Bifidobacterium sp. ESL0775]WEV69449.1 BspA family leucine-rich repeat surface protein [Bifidobacterium sp. ESL0775]